MRARCADGPFVGQTFEFPHPRVHWEWTLPVADLVWINYGLDRYCYQPVRNRHCGDWRLVYRDTF